MDSSGSIALDEVDVRSRRAKIGMAAQRRTDAVERVRREPGDGDDHVRDGRAHPPAVKCRAVESQSDRSEVLGCRQCHVHDRALDLGGNVSHRSDQGHRGSWDYATYRGVTRGTAAAVPAERLASVRIEERHARAARAVG
jgi:hypothetical protein